MVLLKSEMQELQRKITAVVRGKLREYREGLGGQQKHTGQEIAKLYGLNNNRQSEILKPEKYGTPVSWRSIEELIARRFLLVEDIKDRADLTEKELEYIDLTLGFTANMKVKEVIARLQKEKNMSQEDIVQYLEDLLNNP